jgi:hypothetical protein
LNRFRIAVDRGLVSSADNLPGGAPHPWRRILDKKGKPMDDPTMGRHRSEPGQELVTRPAGPVAVPDDSWTREHPLWIPTPKRARRLVIVAATVTVLLVALSVLLVLLVRGRDAAPPAALEPPASPSSTVPLTTPDPSTSAELVPVQTAPPRSSPTPSAASPTAEPGASPSPSVSPIWTALTVSATRVWNLGDVVQTNRTKVALQPDGDLVVIDETGTVRWRSGTAGHGRTAVFQDDGHFVVNDAGQQPWWTSGTAGHNGAVLVLSTDGNVSIVFNGVSIWSTNTAH